MRPGFVELGRTFLPADERQDKEDAARNSYLHFGLDGSSWDDLLQSRVAVILAEAGSGKSTEMEAQAEKLHLPARPAFLVQLQALAAGSLEDALLPPMVARLRAWRASREDGLFFLDSVDESRLLTVEGFRSALRSFAHGIGGAMGRARLVVTSRVSEWRHAHDRMLVCDALGVSQESRKASVEDRNRQFRVVVLAPLSNDQVIQLAAASLGDDAGRFAVALTDANAWDFARRPMDVVPLAQFWAREGRLGTLPELLEGDIGRKLLPRDTRDEPAQLSPQQARHGAERLAAASVLCGKLSFAVPDDSLSGPVLAAALRPQDILADWPQAEVGAVLGRPLFDPAAFGRVRFHHRAVAEYLAAQWLRRLVAEGCPHKRILSLLMPVVRGRRVLVPSLAGVAAWLCGGPADERWLVRLRESMTEVAPEALISHGDPRLLPLAIKRVVLRACMGQGAAGHVFGLDAQQLARLADPGLADDLAAVLSDPGAGEGARRLALRTLWHGRLGTAEAALGIAFDTVLDSTEDADTRSLAMRAVDAAGSDSQRQALSQRLPSSACDMAMAADAVRLLYPGAMRLADLLALAGQFHDVPHLGGAGLPEAVNEAVEMADDAAVPELVQGLVGLIGPTLPSQAAPPASVPFAWLAEPLSMGLSRLLRRPSLLPDDVVLAADALDVAGPLKRIWHQGGKRKVNLQADSERHAQLRAELLRRRLAVSGRDSLFRWNDVVGWCRADLAVLADWATNEQDPARKGRLVRLAADAWNFRTGRDPRDRAMLLRAARHGPAMAEAGGLLPGPAALRSRHFQFRLRQEAEWGFRLRLGNMRVRAKRWRLWGHLLRHRSVLASGRPTSALAHLAHNWLDERREGRGSRAASSEFNDVFGIVVKAARSGWKARWRDAQVALPGSSKGIEYDLSVGLAGFAACLEDGLDISTLSHEEACVAARLAARTLHGVPSWFRELARKQPLAVQQVMEACVRLDWTLEGDAVRHLHIGSWLTRLGLDVRRSVQPLLIELLRQGDPNPDVLRTALEVLLATGPGRHALTLLAPARVATAEPASPAYGHWLWAWLHADAGALDYLEELSASDADMAETVVVQCASMLYSTRDRGDETVPSPAFETVHGLARLVSLLHRHVRPDQDVRHGRGSYTPTLRDDIQQVRDTLLQKLAQRPEPEVYGVLQGLRVHPAMQGRLEWLGRLVAGRLGKEAEQPWLVQDVLAFEREHESMPRSAEALYRLGLARLDDLKGEVEHHMFSTRGELDGSEGEENLQLWTAGKLSGASRGRYACAREPQTDRGKRPDVQLSVPGLHSIPIELKWAHDWTYSQLQRALEHQLVELYLHGPGLRHGILVLANGRKSNGQPRQEWKPDIRPGLSFNELVRDLQGVAGAILDRAERLDGLAVIGIDFTSDGMAAGETGDGSAR